MKKTLMIISLSAVMLLSGMRFISAQEQPKPKKDTVNMDSQAKPTNYYAIEDDKTAPGKAKSSSFPIIIIVGSVVIVGAAAFFLLKKKKH